MKLEDIVKFQKAVAKAKQHFQIQEMFGGRHEDRLGSSRRRTSTTVRQVPEVDDAQQVQSIHPGGRNQSTGCRPRLSSRQRA